MIRVDFGPKMAARAFAGGSATIPIPANVMPNGTKAAGLGTLPSHQPGGQSPRRAYARWGARKSTDRRAVTAGIVHEHSGVGGPQPRCASDQEVNQVLGVGIPAIEAEADVAKSV